MATGAAAGDRHARKVERIARELRQRTSSRPVSFRKTSVSHQVPKRRDETRRDDKLDLGDLNEILEIDAAARTCTAEPGVTFVDLVREAGHYGLSPIIVPELKTITIGGAVSGCSLESRSFQYGGFHDTCLEYEVVTAKGEVLHCTPTGENQLIFQMMHGSFGTLGVLSKLKFNLLPAKPFVHLTHVVHDTLDGYKADIWRHFVARDVDFVDGFVHSPRNYVLCLGRFVDAAPYTNRYDWLKVFYRSTKERREDYLATPDYFFRYDNGVTNVHPKSAVGRLLFGRFMHSARLLRLAERLHRWLPGTPKVTVDLLIPSSKLESFMSWYERAVGFYPLWCVPYRRVRNYEWIARDYLAEIKDELFIDLAVYGMKQRGGRNYYKELEDELLRVRGIKTLISHNYYEEAVFWQIFDKPNYLAAKKVTDPDNVLRDIYTKTCRVRGP